MSNRSKKYSSSCSCVRLAVASSPLPCVLDGQCFRFLRIGAPCLLVCHFNAGGRHDHSVAYQFAISSLGAWPRKTLRGHLQAAARNDQTRCRPLRSRDAPNRQHAKRGKHRRSVSMSMWREPSHLAAGDAGCVLTVHTMFCEGKKLCQFQCVTHLNTARIRCAMLQERIDICKRLEPHKRATTHM